MKYFSVCALLLLLITACDLGEEMPDCTGATVGTNVLTLTVQDSTGTNLIENGTFHKDTVAIVYNYQVVGGVPTNPNFDDLIALFLNGQRGPSEFVVYYNSETIDTLQLDLSYEYLGTCGGNDYTIEEAEYNNEIKTVTKDSLGYNIVVVK